MPDHTYNYPRVWYLQHMFSPSIKNDVTRNTFPVFAKAEKPITLADLRKAYRSHYDNTEHDPYLHNNPKEPYRPISIFRTLQTHILQVRPELPKEIGCINYLAMGMGDLSVFLPLYQGVKSYPEAYTKRAPEHSTPDSAYWTFRKVMTLGMVNYNKYAPLIKETYAKLEAEFDQRQKEMEANYLKVYKTSPMKAQDMLQVFSDYVLTKALHVASELAEELMTRLTKDMHGIACNNKIPATRSRCGGDFCCYRQARLRPQCERLLTLPAGLRPRRPAWPCRGMLPMPCG